MKKIVIIVSVIVIIIGGYLIIRSISSGDELSSVAVARGEVIQNVSVTGTVISAKQIELQFESSGKIKTIEAEVGNRVDVGQVLIRLDATELQAQLQASLAALDIAQAKLAQTLAGNRPEDIQIYQAAVDKAELEVTNKEQALVDAQINVDTNLSEAYEDALDTCRTSYTIADQSLLITFIGIRQEYFNSSSQLAFGVRDKENIAKNDLSIAEDYLAIAEDSSNHNNIDSVLDRMQTAVTSIRDALSYLRAALDDPSISNSVSASHETSIDTARSNIDSELVALTSAEQNVDSTKVTNQTNINTAQANLDAAKASLSKIQDELVSKQAGPRQIDIDLSQAEVNQARAKVAEAQARISKIILKAPVAGTITAIEKEVGETAQANLVIVSIISDGVFQIEANVSETEIAKVSLGDKVVMTLDALGPEEEFAGQIVKIDPAETVVSGVIYYRINSVFDAEDERIKSGMTVNLDIETDKKGNVLYLPYYLVKEKNNHKYVLVLSGKEVKERTIKTGLEGETTIEIIEGLEEGEEVVAEESN